MSLTEKQKNFARNIVNGMAKGEAAIQAKYSKKSANSIATENLNKPKIKAYIEKLEEERESLVRKKLSYAAEIAVGELIKVLSDSDTPPQTKTNTAKVLLDYAGYKPIDKQETTLSGDLDIGQRARIVEKYLKSDDDDVS